MGITNTTFQGLMAGASLLLLNACAISDSPQHSLASGFKEASIVLKDCDVELAKTFESTYYPMVSSSCTACHRTGGPGNGAFADPNPAIAYTQFMLKGAAKIDAMATSQHNFDPSLIPSHQTKIDSFKTQWLAAEDTHRICLGSEPKFVSTFVAFGSAPPTRPAGLITFSPVSWVLDGFPGTVSADIRPYYTGDRLSGYEFLNPTIQLESGATANFSFRGLRIEVSGTAVVHDYAGVSGVVEVGQPAILRPGYFAYVQSTIASPAVQFRVSFDDLKVQSAP